MESYDKINGNNEKHTSVLQYSAHYLINEQDVASYNWLPALPEHHYFLNSI